MRMIVMNLMWMIFVNQMRMIVVNSGCDAMNPMNSFREMNPKLDAYEIIKEGRIT